MTNRTRTGIVLLVLAQGLAGCGRGSSSAPSAPSPVPQVVPPAPIRDVVFTDIASGFSTSDVRDAQDQIVRFNTAGELIWTADDSRFPGLAAYDGSLEVRFGTKNGEPRAYLTFSMSYYHYGPPATVIDLEVVDGKLIIIATTVPVSVPQT